MKLQEYIFVCKEKKNALFNNFSSVSFWCHMDYFNYVLTTFLGLDSGSFVAHLCRVRKLCDLIKNIQICVPKMNKGRMGLERHEGFIFVELSL